MQQFEVMIDLESCKHVHKDDLDYDLDMCTWVRAAGNHHPVVRFLHRVHAGPKVKWLGQAVRVREGALVDLFQQRKQDLYASYTIDHILQWDRKPFKYSA